VHFNYLVHECSHVVAYRSLFGHGPLNTDTASGRRAFVFSSLVTECFANAMDEFTVRTANSRTELLLAILNTYSVYRREDHDNRRTAIELGSIHRMFVLACLHFWMSNTNQTITPEISRDVFKLVFSGVSE